MSAIDFDNTITLSCSVTDIDTSIAWFQEMLGFEESFRAPEAGWAEITSTTAGVTIGLGQNEAVSNGGGNTVPVFGVKDINAARQTLADKGVRFDGDIVEIPGMVKLATFFDPDGNSYMFAQSLVQAG